MWFDCKLKPRFKNILTSVFVTNRFETELILTGRKLYFLLGNSPTELLVFFVRLFWEFEHKHEYIKMLRKPSWMCCEWRHCSVCVVRMQCTELIWEYLWFIRVFIWFIRVYNLCDYNCDICKYIFGIYDYVCCIYEYICCL